MGISYIESCKPIQIDDMAAYRGKRKALLIHSNTARR
jgi:hypothetical protein